MLLLGFLYLAFRKNIKPLPPLLYVATVFIVTFFFANGDSEPIYFALMHTFSGSVFLAAVLCLGLYDYALHQARRGGYLPSGSALLTVLLRYFGDYCRKFLLRCSADERADTGNRKIHADNAIRPRRYDGEV